MPNIARQFGLLKNSFGLQMTIAMRAFILLMLSKVAKELSEMVNHAWGLLFLYLAESGDAVVAAARLPNATPNSVRVEMEWRELNLWHTTNAGVYMVNPLFHALLDLGHDVFTG